MGNLFLLLLWYLLWLPGYFYHHMLAVLRPFPFLSPSLSRLTWPTPYEWVFLHPWVRVWASQQVAVWPYGLATYVQEMVFALSVWCVLGIGNEPWTGLCFWTDYVTWICYELETLSESSSQTEISKSNT